MTALRPPIELPTEGDINKAVDELFPEAAHFGEQMWRLWTDEERRMINTRAYEIMLRRETTH